MGFQGRSSSVLYKYQWKHVHVFAASGKPDMRLIVPVKHPVKHLQVEAIKMAILRVCVMGVSVRITKDSQKHVFASILSPLLSCLGKRWGIAHEQKENINIHGNDLGNTMNSSSWGNVRKCVVFNWKRVESNRKNTLQNCYHMGYIKSYKSLVPLLLLTAIFCNNVAA